MGIVYLFKLNVVNVERMREKRDVMGLIKALQYKSDLEVRINAEKALGDVGDIRAVVPLIQALKDENWRVRSEAARALGKIKGALAVETLVHALEDEDSDVRKRAAAALGNIGEPAVEPLIHALKDEDSDVRKRVTVALDKIGWTPGDDTERSHYLIAKKEWAELTRLGEPAVEPLIQALEDESWEVRKRAAEVLGKIGDARAVEPLIQALKDEYWNVNKKAEEALGEIGEPAVEPLIQALKDEEPALSHSQPAFQQAVKDALEKIEKRG
ncbi:MAG: HEAT repeat domain-containing protein [Halobacteriota archaeon]